MTETKLNNHQKTCPSCGAPVVSEICAYCGIATGPNSANADMEYPTLECKEVTISFWTIWFPMIFAGAFGVPGFILLMFFALFFRHYVLLLLGVPFFMLGVIMTIIILRTVLRYIKVKNNGKTIQGTVYGYIDDSFRINDQPAKIIKLLVQTPKGPRFILYHSGSTLKKYGINDKIDLLVYKSYFMIHANKEAISW